MEQNRDPRGRLTKIVNWYLTKVQRQFTGERSLSISDLVQLDIHTYLTTLYKNSLKVDHRSKCKMKSYKTHVCLYTRVCVWTGENSACLWAWQWVCFVLCLALSSLAGPALSSQSTDQGLNQEPGTESSEPWPLGCQERPAVSFKYDTKDTAHEGKNRRTGLNEDIKLFYERHWREWENKIQIRRKYLQITFYIKDLHPKYI